MFRIIIVWATLLPSLAVAQPTSLVSEGFVENYDVRVRVSGEQLVGVVLSGGADTPAGTALHANALSIASTTLGGVPSLCVRAKSQNGRYTATNRLRVDAAAVLPPVAGVTWLTEYTEKLDASKLSEIAILAIAGPCGKPAEIIPVSMGAGAGASAGAGAVAGDLQVIVNTSGQAVTAALRDPSDNKLIRRVKCAQVAGGERIAFDAMCNFGKIANLKGALPTMRLYLDQVSSDGTRTENLLDATVRVPR